MLGVVTPEMYDAIYKGRYSCSTCGNNHNYVKIDDDTVIKEFSQNYYIEPHDGCGWSEEQRYCVLVKWDDFIKNPEEYVNQAYDKRSSTIASKITVRAKR